MKYKRRRKRTGEKEMKYSRRIEISGGGGTVIQKEKNKKWGEGNEVYEKRRK
jgi:hypothetical protein